ncbi:OLC1v1025160C1 [Oldenlandia corymbosa var. corymbosa]|uniref:OLC1v1025160C1 n=1 Tax=Oldenlandia corymbosa var. corymbosa TaxID=529605 RepID=A0AAV1C4R6_OLDCO|nr:OLC1v1025160C1 [Oldenlandia corymbosa var. corymbosa]
MGPCPKSATVWNTSDSSRVVQSRINWVGQLRNVIGSYVPNNPRAQYTDYRDLDLGSNNVFGRTSVEQARVWGYPYFKEH